MYHCRAKLTTGFDPGCDERPTSAIDNSPQFAANLLLTVVATVADDLRRSTRYSSLSTAQSGHADALSMPAGEAIADAVNDFRSAYTFASDDRRRTFCREGK